MTTARRASVEDRRDLLEVRARGRPAAQCHDRTEQDVPGGQGRHLEASTLEDLAQRGPGVAPDVVHGHVVLGPQPGVGGHGDEEASGGPQHPQHLGDRRVVVEDVLEHVERDDQVEAVVGHRQRRGVPAQHGQPSLGRHRRPVGAVLQGSDRPAGSLQDPGVAPARRADVHGSPGPQAPDRLPEQVPALLVPPVRVLDCRQLANLSAFHGQPSCQQRWLRRAPARRPPRSTWWWSARGAPSARARAASGWRCRSRRRTRTRPRR